MIKVDNSHEKRVFGSSNNKDVQALIIRVENKLQEIEKQAVEERYYEDLSSLELEQSSNQVSVFIFKKKITLAIESLLLTVDNILFKEELIALKKNIYKLLVGDFKTIKYYINELIKNGSLLVKGTDKNYQKYQQLFEQLYKDELSSKQALKKSFFDLFKDVNVCPYCNRNYINPIYKEISVRTGEENKNQSPDIEHFFPKSFYPLLSLSISNLLPSCSFCNKIKSNCDTFDNFRSPYEVEKDDFTFKFEALQIGKRTIKLETTYNNSSVLHLENLYANVHSEFVNDIFLELRKYPIENRQYLNKFFALPYDTQEKLYKKKFCNYYKDDDFNKQALSKMTKDLFLQVKEDEEDQ